MYNNNILFQGASTVMDKYNESMSSALFHLFPDIGFDVQKFHVMPSIHILFIFIVVFDYLVENHWAKLENRRKVFENFANEKGFDPLLAEKWYSMLSSDFMKQKVA